MLNFQQWISSHKLFYSEHWATGFTFSYFCTLLDFIPDYSLVCFACCVTHISRAVCLSVRLFVLGRLISVDWWLFKIRNRKVCGNTDENLQSNHGPLLPARPTVHPWVPHTKENKDSEQRRIMALTCDVQKKHCGPEMKLFDICFVFCFFLVVVELKYISFGFWANNTRDWARHMGTLLTKMELEREWCLVMIWL